MPLPDASGTVVITANLNNSAASRYAFTNGSRSNENTTNLVPSSIDRTSIGVGDGSSASDALVWGGMIAEAGIWNAALIADEAGLSRQAFPPTGALAKISWPTCR